MKKDKKSKETDKPNVTVESGRTSFSDVKEANPPRKDEKEKDKKNGNDKWHEKKAAAKDKKTAFDLHRQIEDIMNRLRNDLGEARAAAAKEESKANVRASDGVGAFAREHNLAVNGLVQQRDRIKREAEKRREEAIRAAHGECVRALTEADKQLDEERAKLNALLREKTAPFDKALAAEKEKFATELASIVLDLKTKAAIALKPLQAELAALELEQKQAEELVQAETEKKASEAPAATAPSA